MDHAINGGADLIGLLAMPFVVIGAFWIFVCLPFIGLANCIERTIRIFKPTFRFGRWAHLWEDRSSRATR